MNKKVLAVPVATQPPVNKRAEQAARLAAVNAALLDAQMRVAEYREMEKAIDALEGADLLDAKQRAVITMRALHRLRNGLIETLENSALATLFADDHAA